MTRICLGLLGVLFLHGDVARHAVEELLVLLTALAFEVGHQIDHADDGQRGDLRGDGVVNAAGHVAVGFGLLDAHGVVDGLE
jgi:hypothetical protein